MALFVIYGNMNSGKTHTCWLIHALLKNAGNRLTLDTTKTQPDWKIAIFSAGDFLHDPNWEVTSFDDNMAWAKKNNADHVICCARSLNRKGSVQRYILDNHKMSIYRWYWKDQSNILQDQIADAQKVAIEIFTDIKSNC